jgi:hypothetical protein
MDIFTNRRFVNVGIKVKRGISVEYIAKTLWNGKVGVPDFIIQDCINRGEKLTIAVQGEGFMTIPTYELGDRIVGQSDRKFSDKYKRDFTYYLKYIKWQPQERVVKLL